MTHERSSWTVNRVSGLSREKSVTSRKSQGFWSFCHPGNLGTRISRAAEIDEEGFDLLLLSNFQFFTTNVKRGFSWNGLG